MTFHDRGDELDALETAFDSPEYAFFVIYGRRRVGKTELIKAFCSERPHIYFLAAQEAEERQREKFVERVAGHFEIRWFETDEFSIHYAEQYRTGKSWECRWDRHPNDHNTREHFHPPPDASTPGVDNTFPTDWRDVLTTVLIHLDDRIREFWNNRAG